MSDRDLADENGRGAKVISRSAWSMLGAAGLVLSIAALSALFLLSVDRAALHFARAAASQDQFAQVLAVREAARSGDAARERSALARYRDSIIAEDRLLSPAERVEQGAEQADYRALVSATGTHGAGFERLIERIAHREQQEAAESARRMAHLRRRASLLAIVLAVCAVLSGVVGGVGLATVNRRLSREVAARTAQIAAVDASRRLFYAKVSHELKTPVTIMRGEAEVALATGREDPAMLAAALREVVTYSELLNRRVEELLALSQAEDGRLELVRAPVDLAGVVMRAVSRVGPHAASNRVSLRVSGTDALTMSGDARWLEQAVVAVLDNAIKFSPEDTEVQVSVQREEPWGGIVRIADRGPGVERVSLPRLFDAYYQAEEGRARGGNGLGLALSRWIVEQHGGAVDAAVRDGGGCVVTLKLPVAA